VHVRGACELGSLILRVRGAGELGSLIIGIGRGIRDNPTYDMVGVTCLRGMKWSCHFEYTCGYDCLTVGVRTDICGSIFTCLCCYV
jgi:hypothetical protein